MDRVQTDQMFMGRCLELARRGEGKTSPNPMVGSVIVDRRGRVVAEGYHCRLGAPHAEADALRKAGERAKGCTMYVNLEPCKHVTKRRTSPCAPRVLAAGIRRLVVGMGDPIRSHGGGALWLAKNGVEVTRGVLERECRELNRGFVMWAKRNRPFFVAKAGITLDGKIATSTGQSQWITGAKARRDAHQLRARADAIVVGIGTVLADDPQLTVRVGRGMRDPVRVVVDSNLRTPESAALLPQNSSSSARVVIATSPGASKQREQRLRAAGADVWRVGKRTKTVDLNALARSLAASQLTTVLVEGGAAIHAGFLRAGLIDEVVLYVAPMVFGDKGVGSTFGWVGDLEVKKIVDAHRFRYVGAPRYLGRDVVLTARPTNAR